VLSVFEQLSGLKINFHKSEMFYYGGAKEWVLEYSKIFGCDIGAHYLFDTWECPCVTANSAIVIEDKLKRGFKNC
jgi:hypothetical protein